MYLICKNNALYRHRYMFIQYLEQPQTQAVGIYFSVFLVAVNIIYVLEVVL